MLCTRKRLDVAGFLSTSSFPIFAFPAISFANTSIIGATTRHGPHQAAQKSTRTGSFDLPTSSAKLPSVITTGAAETVSGNLHLPQTACLFASNETRFFAPQFPQVIICVESFITALKFNQNRLHKCRKRIRHPQNNLNASANRLHQSASHLHSSANQLYTSANGLNASAKHLDTSANRLHTSANDLSASASHLNTSANHLNTSANHLHTSATSLHTSARNLHTSAKTFNSSVESLHTSVRTLYKPAVILHTSVKNIQKQKTQDF